MTARADGPATRQLLATKLHAPRRRSEVVARPRLDHRLGTVLPRLTLVSAPAGFGKSTLLAEGFVPADGAGGVTAWLALDAADNDPALFGAYVVTALRSVAPQVDAHADELLESSSLSAVMVSLVNDLAAVAHDVVLVLDDYHVIDSAEVHEAITFLVDHSPPAFHLVLASRADPPLPLARWRARGDLLEIRAAELRFTADEAAAYFNDSMGLHLTAADVSALEARTEGWIAALQLAALSLRGRADVAGFIESFTGDDRFVVDYLAEEVLERQPVATREFLLRTAVLHRFTGSLCDAVTGTSGGKATLEMLDRSNLFLVALDDRRQWYRYHHLFADVLRARLLDEQPESIAQLHLRASEWFDAHGDAAEAIRHAMAGEHFDRAAQLIELAAPAARRLRQDATVRRWLEALPAQVFDNRPVLSVALIGARMVAGDPTGVEALLDTTDEWLRLAASTSAGEEPTAPGPIVFNHEEYAGLPAQVAVFRAGLALLGGDPAGTIHHASRVFELTGPADHLHRGSAAALMGLAHWSTGDLEAAREWYTSSLACFVKVGYISDFLGCSLALADIQIALGRLTEARRTYESALQHAAGHPGLRGTADMHVGLAELCLERGQLGEAAQHLQASADLGEHAGLPQHAYRWRLTMARLRQAQGDLDGALQLLDEADRLYNTDFSPGVRPIAAVTARVRLAQGDVAAARRWVAERRLTPDDELTYLREYEHLTLARVLVAEADGRGGRSTDSAIRFLQRLLDSAERGGREGTAIAVLVLLSIAHDARGDRAAAATALAHARERARAEGHALELADISADAPARTGLVDELSARELDVLRLLRSDLSGPDIARELHVSLNTLRTHTKSIFTKLGATSRREAVRRAAELGL